ncbi:translocation/assembly module TamB [Sphingobacterium olei]|uniref:Translocation/assembly module TamB n=1 Tax=Sphingobacterium olei TaxID=2571155 RepID=A0A4V5MML7_9SPHI|nr:translocation/assembly module TamB domain-containing protein [Sphingobacterium olei]TJZ61378.1 translocation/assembly module TamB [Sphingobacterium olei]
MNRLSRIFLKTILWILGAIIALLLLVIFLIRLPSVQNYVVGKVTSYLENKIGTPVNIGYINITFPKKLVLENVYFEDQSQDTLLAGEKLSVDINMFKLFKNTVEIQELDLAGITAKIIRTAPDGAFNFDYILKAFTSEKESAIDTDTASALVFDIDKVNFDRIRFIYKDDMIGTSADIGLTHFDTRVKNFDLTNNMSFDMPVIHITGLNADIKQWAPATAATTPTAEDFGITDQSVENSSLLPNLATRSIILKDILVRYTDSSSAMNTKFYIKNLSANVAEIDLNKEIVRLNEIMLKESDSYVFFGKQNNAKVNSALADTSASMSWIVSANKLSIEKTNFWFKDDNQSRTKGFDYSNIKITDLAGGLDDLYYAADSISGSLANLSIKDHSGFYLKQLKADFVYSSTGATIENLLAETNKTIIRDYIKVTYPSLEAISSNPSSMTIDARINKSQIDMSDIRYFVPDLENIEAMKPLITKRFYLDGRIQGRLNDLHIPKLEFKTLDNTHIIASADISGLPDMDRMNVNLSLKKFTTSRRDIERLVDKSLLPDSIQLPNSISLSGTLKGGMSGGDVNMSLITDKGNATVNGSLNMGQRDTTYDAYVSIDNFNIGHILNQDSVLGIIAMDANIKGHGLNPQTMAAEVSGTINRLDAMGYSYKGIVLDLTANDGDIAGNVTSPDPNIKFNLDLAADMRGQYPKANMELMIDSVNLKNLNLTTDHIRYHGKITADFETADLNYLNGKIDITQSSIAYNENRFALDTISLAAIADTSRNTLVLNSEFLNAHLVGKYKLTELGSSIQDISQVYYNPKNVLPDTTRYEDQNFEFSAAINNSRFIRDFFPQLEEMQDVTLDGTFDSKSKSIMAKLIAPKIIYDGMEVENVGIDINTLDSTLYYSALINRIKISNIELINTVLSGKVIENNLDFGLWIKDKQEKDRYHLGAKMAVNENNYILSLFEDGLMLNYDKWNISSANEIAFGTDGIRAHDFRLSNNGQELLIQSQDSTLNAPIDVTFNNFRIETFSKMLESETLDLGGGINGSATLSRLESSPVFVSDIEIKKFFFGADTIGNILVKVNNETENTFAADVRITENGNDVQLIGQYYTPPTGESSFNATLDLKPMKLTTVQAFSMGSLQDADGDLVGSLKITGSTAAPRINGELTFQQGKLNVTMLNADFLMNNQKISFNNQGIQFRQFEIKDARGNFARLNGTVRTTTYSDFDFNLNLTTDDFAVVNSTREDNDLFFGKLYVSSNIRVRGNLNKPSVDGDISVNENTDFVFIIPNENPGVAERDGVVKFVDKSDTSRANVFAKLDSLTTASTLSGFDVALNISTDPGAKFKVIIDEGSQDALNIQGIAELNTTIDANSNITMSGTYTVEDGNYSFNFGPVSRAFKFQKGSTITWNGDPLDARLDITALYKGKFPTLELVSNQIGAENQNLYKQRIPFDVKLILTGELFKPNINFDIDMDEDNAMVSQDVVSKVNIGLTTIREDPAELNKQVFSLIILGRFMSANPFESLSGGGGVEGMARNSVSSLLTAQLNNLASDLIKGVELDFNLQSEQDYLTGSGQNRTDLNVGVSKMLFDDRLKVTIGSNFEVEGNTRPGEKPSNIAGDISLDYQLSKDGRYFARVYRKNQYQATLQGQFVETGIGFIITMDYNKFKELFMNSKALEEYYNADTRSFRRRFDVERMDSDSVYRDSVRLILRDSLMKHSPEFRKRVRERERQELKQQPDSTNNSTDTNSTKAIKDTANTVIRNEDEERYEND